MGFKSCSFARNIVLGFMTSCTITDTYERFGDTYCLCLPDRNYFFRTSVTTYHNSRSDPENHRVIRWCRFACIVSDNNAPPRTVAHCSWLCLWFQILAVELLYILSGRQERVDILRLTSEQNAQWVPNLARPAEYLLRRCNKLAESNYLNDKFRPITGHEGLEGE